LKEQGEMKICRPLGSTWKPPLPQYAKTLGDIWTENSETTNSEWKENLEYEKTSEWKMIE
jgi:hypothetical protein